MIPIQVTGNIKIKLITFVIGNQKVQYAIPHEWSVNKTKCLLITEFSTLKFNQFELMSNGKLLNGRLKIREVDMIGGQQKYIKLFVTYTKSEVKFQDYYSQNFSQYLAICKHKHEPVMHTSYQSCFQKMNKLQYPQRLQLDPNQLEQNLLLEMDRQIFQIFSCLKLIGFTLLAMLLLLRATLRHFVIIFVIYLLHYVIDILNRKFNKKSTQNNQKQQAQIREQKKINKQDEGQDKWINSMKGLILMLVYKGLQITFYLILSLYPNWDVNLHNNICRRVVARWRNHINSLRPGTYQN